MTKQELEVINDELKNELILLRSDLKDIKIEHKDLKKAHKDLSKDYKVDTEKLQKKYDTDLKDLDAAKKTANQIRSNEHSLRKLYNELVEKDKISEKRIDYLVMNLDGLTDLFNGTLTDFKEQNEFIKMVSKQFNYNLKDIDMRIAVFNGPPPQPQPQPQPTPPPKK